MLRDVPAMELRCWGMIWRGRAHGLRSSIRAKLTAIVSRATSPPREASSSAPATACQPRLDWRSAGSASKWDRKQASVFRRRRPIKMGEGRGRDQSALERGTRPPKGIHSACYQFEALQGKASLSAIATTCAPGSCRTCGFNLRNRFTTSRTCSPLTPCGTQDRFVDKVERTSAAPMM